MNIPVSVIACWATALTGGWLALQGDTHGSALWLILSALLARGNDKDKP